MATTDVQRSAPFASRQSDAVRLMATQRSAIPATTTYSKRARIISTGEPVYWTVTGDPDATGARSGHAGDVADVVTLVVSAR